MSSCSQKSKGDWGEQLAADFLVSQGYRLLSRNVRLGRLGELDLIFLSPEQETVVFVEVKTTASHTGISPELLMTRQKVNRLYRLAEAYLLRHPVYAALTPRLDFLGVSLTDGQACLDHRPGIMAF